MSAVKAWSAEDVAKWYRELPVIPGRDYRQTILPRIQALGQRPGFKVDKYGETLYAVGDKGIVRHPLYAIVAGDLNPNKETFVVVGGTHGYEKGGPLAALGFAEEEAGDLMKDHNLVIYPCIAPCPYEREEREVEGGLLDPNRDAHLNGAQSQEMRSLARSVRSLHRRLYGYDVSRKFAAVVDLHETPGKDVEINERNIARGGEEFEGLEPFPHGMFLLGFEKDKAFLDRVIAHVKSEGHEIVSDDLLYGKPNQGGLLLAPTMDIPATGPRVRNLMANFARVSLTTESCGKHITDAMDDAARAEPQRAVIRGLFAANRPR